jgi:hypothetical protein
VERVIMINNGEPIDGNSVNDLYNKIENVKDKLINLIWRNSSGNADKTIRSLDGKEIQVLAGTIDVKDKTSKTDESAVRVEFYRPFGGSKSPTVVAMPESASPYGVSIKNITKNGFTLVIHQFPDNGKDDRLNLNNIHYIAVGMP